MNNTIIIKNILNNVNLKNFNYKIIKKNINYLIEIFVKIKKIYMNINNIYIIKSVNNNLQKTINKHIITFTHIVKSKRLVLEIKKFTNMIMLEFENIKFFYVYDTKKKLENDLQKIYFLFKISITLSKFKYPNDSTERYIIWIPINSARDFKHNIINNDNLNNSINEFEAFTASGVTFGDNPRITVISRYEEIEKLLIHELIHNLYLDGSNYHNEFTTMISDYIKIKMNKKSKIENYHYEYSIYESYTELLSTYFYLLFININLSEQELYKTLLGQVCIEIIYSYNTIANLSFLNGYKNYDEFIINKSFLGNICFYEYYFIKGIMYNYFLLVMPNNKEKFMELYQTIINIISNYNSDLLLKDIFNNYSKQKNFKYICN
jgi:hypothetical protein